MYPVISASHRLTNVIKTAIDVSFFSYLVQR